ncbi:CobW/HypB/UreG, nucleotide-binding domain [Actinokineospora terrae]|uniref:CobW/HypB/UreG, nucleotide-binding domain n=1 Tax=Actinokineospora terrae TaxID=155974 RepID=A0A1H9QSS1_9PSEU|nr:CobW/HypB/UreG, nucleotide-binding domain [Actinokineospora terrae]
MDIPVLVVAGFLGAGKTTLLNHLLHTASDLRVGVIVNDFGKVNIDALTVAAQVDSMVSLGNGCLCCAVDPEELDAMLERLAHPDGPVDVIVIEASGLAEPPAMVKMVLASANPHIRYGGLVEVVDAAEFTESRRAPPTGPAPAPSRPGAAQQGRPRRAWCAGTGARTGRGDAGSANRVRQG